MTTELVLETTALSRSFGRRAAVTDLALRVRRGTVYGLIGPNGAGKSTTFNLLLGRLPAHAGEIRLFGAPWHSTALSRIGASVNGPSFYPHLSAEQNLLVHARLLGVSRARVRAVLAEVGLAEVGRQKAKTFSTGMRGRLALAIALLGDPELLLLDEPQNGLDPEGIHAMRGMIRRFAETGRTVVVSSHLLGELAHVADDIGVLAEGTLRYQGRLGDFASGGDLESAFFELTRGGNR